jgi:hypothetical protein
VLTTSLCQPQCPWNASRGASALLWNHYRATGNPWLVIPETDGQGSRLLLCLTFSSKQSQVFSYNKPKWMAVVQRSLPHDGHIPNSHRAHWEVCCHSLEFTETHTAVNYILIGQSLFQDLSIQILSSLNAESVLYFWQWTTIIECF